MKHCTNRAIHAALENVNNTLAPYKLVQNIICHNGLYLSTNTINNGHSATKKNPQLIGLSKRNWLRGKPSL